MASVMADMSDDPLFTRNFDLGDVPIQDRARIVDGLVINVAAMFETAIDASQFIERKQPVTDHRG